MEKIYMQDNNNGQKNNNQLNMSVVLSFAVAIFAIFSLVAFGFNQVSYAAPDDEDDTTVASDSKKFTLVRPQEVNGLSPTGEKADVFIEAETSDVSVPFLTYVDANGKSVFVYCIEKSKNTDNGLVYERSGELSKAGLTYILNHQPTTENQYVNYWITQVAIWIYNGDIKADDVKNVTYLNLNTTIDGTKYGTDIKLVEEVNKLVQNANTFANTRMLTVNKKNDTLSKVVGDKYYQVGPITVTGFPASDLLSYDVSINGVEGAFLVDSAGKNLNPTGIKNSKEFYVRIPVKQVDLKAKKLVVSVNGHFSTLKGYEFTTTDTTKQKIIALSDEPITASNGTQFEIVGAPDTGMNTAQTIYFIGLIVLLCGVGIVYANAKPVES